MHLMETFEAPCVQSGNAESCCCQIIHAE